MLKALEKRLDYTGTERCTVGRWEDSQEPEDKTQLEVIKSIKQRVSLASLYKDLQDEVELPFKLTAFRAHMGGYCTCRS